MVFNKLRMAGLLGMAVCAVACVVERDHVYDRPYATGSGSSSGGPSGGAGPSTADAGPILVMVDPDKTMDAAPGEGVGVFIEYGTGGHWYVWWTCDTNVNTQGALACEFALKLTVTQGAMALTASQAPAGAVLTKGAPVREIDATTTTGAEIHSVSFDTEAGAVLTIDAAVGGQRDPRYFFFVQDGQVNGGYTGALSDPIMVQGARP